MKFLILAILIIILFSGCATWHQNWALLNGYIKAEDLPEPPPVPERQALPHPNIPIFQIIDENDNSIKIDEVYLMIMIVKLFGTVEKFQYLVEIYEREYLNAGGKILPDISLEDLKKLYKKRLGRLRDIEIPTTEMTLGAHEQEITLKEFGVMADAWNELQKERE